MSGANAAEAEEPAEFEPVEVEIQDTVLTSAHIDRQVTAYLDDGSASFRARIRGTTSDGKVLIQREGCSWTEEVDPSILAWEV